jgi:hypothetical protein
MTLISKNLPFTFALLNGRIAQLLPCSSRNNESQAAGASAVSISASRFEVEARGLEIEIVRRVKSWKCLEVEMSYRPSA